MRIWDLLPSLLCRQHLLGEHRELHALWVILKENKKGYAHHPETLRWKGKLPALLKRHDALVLEMEKRGYRHATPLNTKGVSGSDMQDAVLHSLDQQMELLRQKGCACTV